MSISVIWKFIKSGAGKIAAGILAALAVFMRIQWVKNQRDNANRAAEVAKSEAKVEKATTKINKAVQQKRAAVAKEQQAKIERDKAEAEAEGKRRDIGGDW